MSALFPKRGLPVVAPTGAPTPPPPVEDVFGEALALADYARIVFKDAVDDLIQANVDLDDVVLRVTSEIDRLADLRDRATAQRRENVQTVERLEALIG